MTAAVAFPMPEDHQTPPGGPSAAREQAERERGAQGLGYASWDALITATTAAERKAQAGDPDAAETAEMLRATLRFVADVARRNAATPPVAPAPPASRRPATKPPNPRGGEPRPIAQVLADKRVELEATNQAVAAAIAQAEQVPDDEWARLDAEAYRRATAQATALRRRRYEQTRPPAYAESALDRLLPQQNPSLKGARWLDSGHKNALIMGPSGHGKTDLLYAICNAAVDQGLWVEAWSVVELVQALAPLPRHALKDEVRSQRQEMILDWAKRCDVLALDDLGAEEAGGFVAERWRAQLLDILSHRDADRRRRNLFAVNGDTTHDKPEDHRPAVRAQAATAIAGRYGDRIGTRLRNDSIGIWVEGDCLRRPATWDPFQ